LGRHPFHRQICSQKKKDLAYREEIEFAEKVVGIVVILEHVTSRAEGDEARKSKEGRGTHFPKE
jgi:hypothetical protein